MQTKFTRRSVLAAGASMLALGALPHAHAQAKTKLRFSSAFTEQDLRADAYKSFAAAIKDGYDFEPYWGNTLFKQGTELIALQRGNLEMVNLAPADISKQIPAWSLMTSAYLFRDAAHLKKTFKSDVGREFIKMAKRSTRHPDHHARLLRIAQRQPEARPPDQDPRRYGGHQAADAARRVLAVSR